jgi:iron complex transport system substrate-binding protein
MADDSIIVADRKVTPERIVSLSPSNTEILFAVGAAPKIVGVTDYCNYPDELEVLIKMGKIERVGGYWNPSLETIVNLKPDLVLVSTATCKVKTNKCKKNCSRSCELTIKAASQLKKIGLNVLILAPHSLNDVLKNILLFGNVTGNDVQAINLVNELQQRIDIVVTKSKTISNRPKVYFEVWNNPYVSVNSRTWIGDLINLAGGTNIFGDVVSEWPVVLPEKIIQMDPDLMVFPVIPNFPRFWESYEAVKNRVGWNTITAVKNSRLHEVPRDFISRPGPRLIEALELLGKMINYRS